MSELHNIKHEARGSASIGEANLGIDKKLRMLEGTARILSENFGVQVVFSEDGDCKTSRERMTLPYTELIDEALIMGLMGFSNVAHVKDSKLLEHPVKLSVLHCSDNLKDKDNQQPSSSLERLLKVQRLNTIHQLVKI